MTALVLLLLAVAALFAWWASGPIRRSMRRPELPTLPPQGHDVVRHTPKGRDLA